MGSKSKYVPTLTRRQLMAIAEHAATADSVDAVLDNLARIEKRLKGSWRERGTWRYYLRRFVSKWRAGQIPHSIFADKGNVKLPFVAFSTLPIVTCPGAGACKEWCYSLTAWRYPAAFLRQLQNTLLLRFNRRAVIEAFKKIKPGRWFRLYVDGDFDSESTAIFWFNLLRQRPDIRAYGYSKSWRILERVAHMVPPNYALNLSSGSIHDGDQAFTGRMLALPFVRGIFAAVHLQRRHKKGFGRFDSPDYHRDVRASATAEGMGKVFSCTGKCGECSSKGPVCGLVEIKLPVAIGIHGMGV